MSNFGYTFLMLLLTSLLIGCQTEKATHQQAEPATPFQPEQQKAVLQLEIEGQQAKSVSFKELYRQDPLLELTQMDHLFGEKRHYIGLNLAQLRKLSGASDKEGVLKLHCRDGYVSEVETKILEQGQFLLAIRDVGAAPESFVPYKDMTFLQTQPAKLESELKNENLSVHERADLEKERDHVRTLAKDMKNLGNQGPFYPVFIPDASLAAENRWSPPFCVDKVTFAKTKTDKTAALPDSLEDDHPAMRGSKLFQQRCSSCHAVNGIGGQVGPDLSRPLSVTEYWDEAALRQMMKDPSKIRANSKMPSFRLKDEMIDDILAYLVWMAKNKKL